MDEATRHPHLVARETFVEVDGVVQPAPAPRFDRTPAGPPGALSAAGEHTSDVLTDWGFAEAEIAGLLDAGAVAQAPTT